MNFMKNFDWIKLCHTQVKYNTSCTRKEDRKNKINEIQESNFYMFLNVAEA